MSGFFNSNEGDRRYYVSFLAEYFSNLVGNGIFFGGNFLKVEPSGNMNIQVLAGKAWINGYYYKNGNAAKVITIEPSHITMSRIDVVVLRLDLSEHKRMISAEIKIGALSDNPLAPRLQRDNAIFELKLAEILVNANVSQIAVSNILDTRLGAECGIVTNLVPNGFTYESIFNQYTDRLNEKNTQWEVWFNEVVTEYNNWYRDKKNEINAWYSDIRTAVFSKMQLNFDNWMYMPGKIYRTRFNSDGSITERIANTLTDVTFVERITSFVGTDVIENIKCSEFNINATKTTTFLQDGGIDAAITGTVGLLDGSTGGGTSYHNLLTNLSYEGSKHTGFAAAADIMKINEELLGVKENLQRALKTLGGGE